MTDAKTICGALGVRWHGSDDLAFCTVHENTRTPALIGGLRRFKAQVNNDGGAIPIWELAQDGNPTNGGDVA